MTETPQPPIEPHAEQLASLKPKLPVLGRGLIQLTAENMEPLNQAIEIVRNTTLEGKEATFKQLLEEGYTMFANRLPLRNVAIAPHGGSWTLHDEPEQEEPTFSPGKTIIDKEEAEIATQAISDGLFTSVHQISGFTFFLGQSSNEAVRAAAVTIQDQIAAVQAKLEPYRHRLDKIEMQTDEEGNVTVTPTLAPEEPELPTP